MKRSWSSLRPFRTSIQLSHKRRTTALFRLLPSVVTTKSTRLSLLRCGARCSADKAEWPDAVAAAIGFEGDAYVVRTLIINRA